MDKSKPSKQMDTPAGRDADGQRAESERPAHSPDEVRSASEWQNGDGMVLRLTLLAAWHLRGQRLGDADPCAFVQEAIVKVLEGRRHWPVGLSLFGCLCGAVRSEISNAAKHKRREAANLRRYAEVKRTMARGDASAEGRPATARSEMEIRQIKELLSGDGEAWRVAEHLMNQESQCPPRDVAKALGWPVERVYTVLRRLRRKLVCYKDELPRGRRGPTGGPSNGLQ